MNLTIIPFHDWRKIQKEGFRTRDAHIIKALYTNNLVEKVLVINRPITYLELVYKKISKRIEGEVILKHKEFTLYEVKENLYVVDFISSDIVGQVSQRHKWFIEAYNHRDYVNFIKKCWTELGFKNEYLITQNIFAFKLAISLPAKSKLFDAWDNFLKFPTYKKFVNDLKIGYRLSAKNIKYWTTNSNENVEYYKNTFSVSRIFLLKNGVKENFAQDSTNEPKDLVNIQRPIIGFGGKISYLMNVDLINYLIGENRSLSFVFVGQILNKSAYRAIDKASNVFFLGDKHYDEYPSYVKNFDICIIPYHIGSGQHGGDSIKAYEYLSTGKKVVGTNGNGLEDLKEYIFIANSFDEFSNFLKDMTNTKPRIDISQHSWKSKAQALLNIFNEKSD